MSQKVRKLVIWHRPSANSRFLTRFYESEIANPPTYSGQKQSATSRNVHFCLDLLQFKICVSFFIGQK